MCFFFLDFSSKKIKPLGCGVTTCLMFLITACWIFCWMFKTLSETGPTEYAKKNSYKIDCEKNTVGLSTFPSINPYMFNVFILQDFSDHHRNKDCHDYTAILPIYLPCVGSLFFEINQLIFMFHHCVHICVLVLVLFVGVVCC